MLDRVGHGFGKFNQDVLWKHLLINMMVAKRNNLCQIVTKILKNNQGGFMPNAVKISDELFEKAKIQSKIFKRSIAGQIEYWAKIGQIIEENPDLPLPFIQDIMIGKEQIKAGHGTPYVFGE